MFSSTGSAAVAAASTSAEQTARLQREIKTQENWDKAMEPQLQQQKAAVMEEMKSPDFGMYLSFSCAIYLCFGEQRSQ